MPRRPANLVRDRIIEVALRLLRTGGLQKLSQPQVARAARVPQGHLTYYFPRRADLIAEVARQFSAEVVEDVAAIATAAQNGALGEAMKLIRALAADRQRTRALVGLLMESERDSKLRTALIENTRTVFVGLAGLLGRPEVDLDVELALCSLWGVGILHLLEGESRRDHADQLLDRLTQWLAVLPPHELPAAQAAERPQSTKKGKGNR